MLKISRDEKVTTSKKVKVKVKKIQMGEQKDNSCHYLHLETHKTYITHIAHSQSVVNLNEADWDRSSERPSHPQADR